MQKKIKVLVIPSDTRGGVGFYRSTGPHEHLIKMFGDEFEVVFNISPDWSAIDYFKEFDIVQFHKGLYKEMPLFYSAVEILKKSGVTIVMDIDDSWDLSPSHPLHQSNTMFHFDEMVKKNLGVVDYVTTTTPLFVEQIKPFNPNVKVLPNAIDPNDKRFIIDRKPYPKVRVGFVMGSAHEADVKQMGNFISLMSPETIKKIQVNLCGFDVRGTTRIINPQTHEVTERAMKPNETTWYRYENMVTDNRRIISEQHRKFLNMYVPQLDYPHVENESYRRCWTKDMNHYFSHYENIDILYAPLEIKHFNYVKSQLKAIECCFSHTALIAQNYGPFTIDLKHALDENGNFNGGNALLVDVDKPENWAKYTEYLVNNPDVLKALQNNIHDTLCDKYNLDTVTRDRAEFYKSILKKK